MEFFSILAPFLTTETFVYGAYFIAFLLIPILLLIAADTLEFEHVHMTYARIFAGALLAVVVGGAFYRIHSGVAVVAALLTTFIWIKLHMSARFFDTFLMVVFGWASGVLFIWSISMVLPFFPQPLPVAKKIAIEVPLHETLKTSWSALECLEISHREIIKEHPEARFYKLTFGNGEPMKGDGQTRLCENYYLTPEGKMFSVVIEDASFVIYRVNSSPESNLRLYSQRGNPHVLGTEALLKRLSQNADFKRLSLFLSERYPGLNEEEILSFSQLIYDTFFKVYVWQVSFGEVYDYGYELAFIIDAQTGNILKASFLEKEAETGEIKRGGEMPF